MSSTYYQYQDVMTKIAHRLMQLDGWTVYGYHADNSDPYTDYFDPAWWGGIATKNGYTLVVNRSYSQQEIRRTYTVNTNGVLSAEIREKIAKLEQMTTERGASEAEEATAKAAIEKLKEKQTAGTETREDYTPGHMANPPRCNWHIEKNGIIIDKGAGLLKFASVPDITNPYTLKEWQDFNNMSADEWKKAEASDNMRRWNESPERAAEIAESNYNSAREKYTMLDSFNNLIARFNNICGGMVGNDGEEGYTYEVRKVTKYKTVYKFSEATNGGFVAGQCFQLKSNFNYGCCRGYVYRLVETTPGTLRAYRVSLKSNKNLTGDANRSNHFGSFGVMGSDYFKEKFLKWIETGAIAWGEVVEVREPYEVEKTFKVDKNGKDYKTTNAAPANTEKTTDYTIKADTDTRDGSPLYVVTLNNRVDAETFAAIREEFKTNGGYYSRFKKGFIFKDYPEFIKAKEETAEAPEAAEATTETAEAPETITEEAKTEETTREATADELNAIFGENCEAITRGRTLYINARGDLVDENNNVFYFKAQEEPAATSEEEPAQAVTNEAPAPGYKGAPSDLFSEKEIISLLYGEQVQKGDGWRARVYFSTPYIDNVCFVYGVPTTDAGTIAPKTGADFAGFIYNGAYYNDFETIANAAADDINAAILQAIPTEEAAEQNAGTLEKYDAERIETSRAADYTRDALTHFIEDTTPELYIYSYRGEMNAAETIKYIVNPAEVVKDHAAHYMSNYGAAILQKYIQYNRTAAALRNIKADKANEAHILKRIKNATTDQKFKTFKLLLNNGETVKADADGVRRMAYCGYLSTWHINTSDRGKLARNEYGRPDDVKPGQIKKIIYSNRVLYSA